MLGAFLLGLGLPFAGFGLLADVAPHGLALGPPALGVASFACGLLLGSRGLYWAPLLTWLGQRAAFPDFEAPFSIMANVAAPQLIAMVASNLRARLRARV
jgi:hypothetical protein